MNGRSISWPSPNRPFKACSAGLTVAYSNLYVFFFMFLVGSRAQVTLHQELSICMGYGWCTCTRREMIILFHGLLQLIQNRMIN